MHETFVDHPEEVALVESDRIYESNLTPELQELVRTPEFKEWFGDWERDPENASKMIDENGEPKLFYFGGNPGITQFNNQHRERTGVDQAGFYSTPRKNNAVNFARQMRNLVTDEFRPSSVYSLFLNARNPYEKQKGDGINSSGLAEMPVGHDAIINAKLSEVVVGDPNQIAIVKEEPVNQ